MSASVLNGPGLTRTVPSGKVPSARWMYGAQCKPGPDGDVERLVEDAAEFRRRQRLAAEAQRADAAAHVAVAEDLEPADLVELLPEPLVKPDLVGVDLRQAFRSTH